LDENIEKSGLYAESSKELFHQLNRLINKYYKNNRDRKTGQFYEENNSMNILYNKSYEYLKSLTIIFNEFPSVESWNQYAKTKYCLNSQSMQYISGLTWHRLRDKIKTDINFKSYFIY